MKTIIAILFIIQFNCLFGQMAIINDLDGYVNVREKENVKSKQIGRVYDVVWVITDYKITKRYVDSL